MVQFDPASVQKLAAALHREAVLIIIKATLLGMIVLGGLGAVVGHDANMEGLAVIGIMIGGAIGFVSGLGRSALLKLQAQQALCQLSIEENVRATAHYLYQAQRRAIAMTAPSPPHTQSVAVQPSRASQIPPAMEPTGHTVVAPWVEQAANVAPIPPPPRETHPPSMRPSLRKPHLCPKCHREGNPGATLCGYCWTKFS
jgi:hypothetical protein